MAKKKVSKRWLQDHINDPYVKLAQQHGYRARAAWKLTELLDSLGLPEPGSIVVDLGAAPGSWSQVVRERLLNPEGKVNGQLIALDRLPMESIPDVTFLQGDFRDDDVLQDLEQILDGKKVDLVISDMAPNLTGIRVADVAAMEHLHELVLDFAMAHLQPNGVLIAKAFQGGGFTQTLERYRQHFRRVVVRKPKASRDRSTETFLIARQLKAG